MKKLVPEITCHYISPTASVQHVMAASVVCISNVVRSLALTEMTTIPDVAWDPEE